MKLILENWNKFLKEQDLNEVTDEELEIIKKAMSIPAEEMPWQNIFGNSYRIIEPLNSLDERSEFGSFVKSLERMGWSIGSPKGGKLLCSKTKVTHYIDGKGNQGVSRKVISLNLPKVATGIVKFIENSRDNLNNKAGGILFKLIQRMGDKKTAPTDAKFTLPKFVLDDTENQYDARVNANDFRQIMKFYDAQKYWVGIDYVGNSDGLKKKFNRLGINYESLQQLAQNIDAKMEDYLKNFDSYFNKSYIIYSRHPVDVFRMSDFKSMGSCHTPPSSRHKYYPNMPSNWDKYNICIVSEVFANGLIAYTVPAENFKMFPPTQESLDKVEDQEIFYDEERPNAGGELEPKSRVRIKSVAFHKSGDENEEAIKIAVPQGKIYGPKVPGFTDAVLNKMVSSQTDDLKEIIKQGTYDGGMDTIFLNNFTRYGGSYQDTGYSVADTIPALFRKISKDVKFQGYNVRYNSSAEQALFADIGGDPLTELKTRLNEIFDRHTGGFIRFNYEAELDYDGSPNFTWQTIVTFDMNIPSSANESDIKNVIGGAVDDDFKMYFDLPETDNYFVSRLEENKSRIQLVYDGDSLGDGVGSIYALEEQIEGIVKKFDTFDYYYDNGAIQLIEYYLEEEGILPTDRNKINNVIQKYDLEDDSWWTVADQENEEHDFFGGEYLNFIAYEDFTTLELFEIKEKIPENMKEAGYKHITDFLNMIVNSDELAGKLALNQDTWDKEKDPNIVIMYDGTTQDLDPEELDQADDIDLRAGVSMYSDYSSEMLDKTGDFLQNNASIDELNERIVAALEKYLVDKLKGQQGITENKKRIKIHVRR